MKRLRRFGERQAAQAYRLLQIGRLMKRYHIPTGGTGGNGGSGGNGGQGGSGGNGGRRKGPEISPQFAFVWRHVSTLPPGKWVTNKEIRAAAPSPLSRRTVCKHTTELVRRGIFEQAEHYHPGHDFRLAKDYEAADPVFVRRLREADRTFGED